MSEITNAQYHADHSRWGSTMVRKYIETPAGAEAIYVLHTLEVDPPSNDMVLGSMVHCLTLEPEKFDAEYLVATACTSRRGKNWKAVLKLAAEQGKTAVLPAQVEMADAMAKTLDAHWFVRDLMSACKYITTARIEEPLFVKDPETGLMLKAKPDWAVPIGTWLILPDIKTTANLDRFPYSVRDYRYDFQAAFYAKVAVLAGLAPSMDVVATRWVVIGKTPPYRDVKIFQPSAKMESRARVDVDDALRRLADSFHTGVWERPDAHEIETID